MKNIIIIIITFLFTQGMPKQLKTGFHWGPACVNIKIEYREYGNPRGNSLPAPQFRGNQVYKLRRSVQENQNMNLPRHWAKLEYTSGILVGLRCKTRV